ncbi:hypothetical protein ZIOFF_074179 [Zingiber officinale]|uniref:Retroviral polymerase SH3-like domain-containing protein n=1 Tax=Zingiber officinale TaxID=94328 RepID=A0A8J5C716_ZINOF|nr:hypothetical protein ZIOFF_074179 [Zingiber officinale]
MSRGQQAMVAQDNEAELRHKSLGHFHSKGIEFLQKNDMAVGFPILHCWIYLLKTKSEVAETFEKFKKQVENECGRSIQIVRSGNGTEYTSATLRHLMRLVKRDKLDQKAEVGIFIGYSMQSKAYRIYQPHNGKVIMSRDVKFFEEEKWIWSGRESVSEHTPEMPVLVERNSEEQNAEGPEMSVLVERNSEERNAEG